MFIRFVDRLLNLSLNHSARRIVTTFRYVLIKFEANLVDSRVPLGSRVRYTRRIRARGENDRDGYGNRDTVGNVFVGRRKEKEREREREGKRDRQRR